jgi:hypothetical protein
VFCSELECVDHLFFECCVAQVMWVCISEITNVKLVIDFKSVAIFWFHGEKKEMSESYYICSLVGNLEIQE